MKTEQSVSFKIPSTPVNTTRAKILVVPDNKAHCVYLLFYFKLWLFKVPYGAENVVLWHYHLFDLDLSRFQFQHHVLKVTTLDVAQLFCFFKLGSLRKSHISEKQKWEKAFKDSSGCYIWNSPILPNMTYWLKFSSHVK